MPFQVPLIIRVPWLKASVGAVTTVKAELIDMSVAFILLVLENTLYTSGCLSNR